MSRGGLDPLADFKSIRELRRKIEEIGPDIVLCNFVKPAIYGTIAAKQAKVPRVVAMLEGLGSAFTVPPQGLTLKKKLIQKIQILLYSIALPKSDVVIFLNPDDPKDLLEKYKIKANFKILGGIGVDLNEYMYTEAPSHPISFIFIGRLLGEKGIFEYLQAAEKIKRKYPKVEFKVLGGIDKARSLGIKQSDLQYYIDNKIVICPGFVNNVNQWLKNSSVFVLPSYYREGVPHSTQQAMASGRAIITTDVPGCRETVVVNENGFLIPKWDVEMLVQKMEYFILNPTKIIEMGKKSRQIAEEKYDEKVVNKKLLDMIANY